MIIDGFVGEIWSVKKKKKCVSLRIQRRRVEVGLIYDVLTWCMLMTLSSYLFSNTGKSVINLSLNFTTMLYINIDRFVYRMCDASDTSFLRNFLRFIELNVIASHRIRIIFDFSNFVDSKISRREEEGKREKKIWSFINFERKEKKEEEGIPYSLLSGDRVRKGTSEF